MDESTMILYLLGGVMAILLLGMILQMMTIRTLKDLQKKLMVLQVPESAAPSKQEVSTTADRGKNDIQPLLRRHASMEESLRAVKELSQVSSLTLSSRDGLVVASTAMEAQEDAALFSNMWNRGEEPTDPRIRVFGVPYRAGTLVGIARSRDRLDDEQLEFMKENMGKILNHWL
jgi:hypothetical protein